MSDTKENPGSIEAGADTLINADKQNLTRKSRPKKARKREQVNAVLELFAELWPLAFTLTGARRQPLKINIHLDIAAALNGAASPAEISTALGCYVGSENYLKSCRKGRARIALDGSPMGCVTEEQANFARLTLSLRTWKSWKQEGAS